MYLYGDGLYFNDFGIFSNKASSGRYIGDQYNYKADTINLYPQNGFGGTEETWHESYPDVGVPEVRSIITTGCSYWTLYSEDFYAGDKICLPPGSGCMPLFWMGDDLQHMYRRVKSVWKGSSCARGVKEVHPARILEPGQLGVFTNNN